MRDRLHLEQGIVENYKLDKDQLFSSYTPGKCLTNWSKNVEGLKEKLKITTENRNRHNLWYELGTCYLLVGENKQALYYYDLVLGLNLNNKKVNSAIYFNLGQIYENSNRDFLAYSYYKLANENGDRGRLSLFKMAILEF